MEKRYRVLHKVPFINEFKKDDILEGKYIRVRQGLIEFEAFPDSFKELMWFEDKPVSELPKKLRARSNESLPTTHNNKKIIHKIEAGKEYDVYDYNIGYSIKNSTFNYNVKIHLETGVITFPLKNFIPIEDEKK